MSSFVSPDLRVAEGQLSTAQVNAGYQVIPAEAKRAITVVDGWVRAIGGSASANTSVDVQDTVTGTKVVVKGIAAGFFEDGEVLYEVAYPQLRQSMLTCPKKLAWPP